MILRILCALMAMLTLSSASAYEPRYPDRHGVATDAAGVLSAQTLEDLEELDDRLDDADVPRLYVAVVDFLDGAAPADYAAGLFDRWRLDDDEILLLVSVGDVLYTAVCGDEAALALPDLDLNALLEDAFRAPFLDLRYDAAVASFATALVKELGNRCDVRIHTSDLFRSTPASLLSSWATLLPSADRDDLGETIHLHGSSHDASFSIIPYLAVIGIIVTLLLVFGRSSGGRRMKHPYAPNPARNDSRGRSSQHRH